MAIQHTHRVTWMRVGDSFTKEVILEAEGEVNADVVVPAYSAVAVSVAFPYAGLKSFVATAENATRLYTNGTNEVQQIAISGGPTGGTFTITYSGQTTGAIAYNATAAAVQTALEALSNIAPGDVAVAGGPLPNSAVTITFIGTLGGANVAAVTTTDSLTGGSSPATAVTTPTAGVAAANSLTLAADSPLSWYEGCGLPNPFTGNVTGLHLSNLGADEETVKLRFLYDPTP